MDFEWDEDKAEANEGKHGVSFPEAETVLPTTGIDRLRSGPFRRGRQIFTMGTSIEGCCS